MTISERDYDRASARALERILEAFDEVDPDLVEAIPSDGVVRFDFQGRRPPWVVNTQRGALQVWLAANRQAWHFAPEGEGEDLRWVAPKTGEELFATLAGLFAEHENLKVEF